MCVCGQACVCALTLLRVRVRLLVRVFVCVSLSVCLFVRVFVRPRVRCLAMFQRFRMVRNTINARCTLQISPSFDAALRPKVQRESPSVAKSSKDTSASIRYHACPNLSAKFVYTPPSTFRSCHRSESLTVAVCSSLDPFATKPRTKQSEILDPPPKSSRSSKTTTRRSKKKTKKNKELSAQCAVSNSCPVP